MPPQLKDLLNQYVQQIKELPESLPKHKSWSTSISRSQSNDEGILLKTPNWGQNYPYNGMTPKIDGENCPTGCVATAMAIVMKYNNWPNQGRNTWSFYEGAWHKDGCIDFSRSFYDFQNYLDSYSPDSEVDTNIGQLFYDAGLAVSTNYQKDASSASIYSLGHIMKYFFKYSSDCEYLDKEDFSDNEWTEILNDNLNKSRPVIYSAFSSKQGHCFVVDGRKNEMYHINWGWDGKCNGYFYLSNLDPYNNEELA